MKWIESKERPAFESPRNVKRFEQTEKGKALEHESSTYNE